jgi:hypothetical protein
MAPSVTRLRRSQKHAHVFGKKVVPMNHIIRLSRAEGSFYKERLTRTVVSYVNSDLRDIEVAESAQLAERMPNIRFGTCTGGMFL